MPKLNRSILLLLVLLLLAGTAHARVSNTVDWRWRNDDGGMETATWMTDEEMQPGTLVGTDEIARLRVRHTQEVDFNDIKVVLGEEEPTFVPYTNYFLFADSPNLEPDDPVGQRLSVLLKDDNPVPYDAGGRVLEAPALVPAAPAGTFQELELCLKVKDADVPEDTYRLTWSGVVAPLQFQHPKAAAITTGEVINIAAGAATAVGEITDPGLRSPREHGACWSATATPDISGNHTTEGPVAEAGAFSTVITGLQPLTTYHVRAYATNSAGTVYGEEVTFTTASMDEESYGAGECFIETGLNPFTGLHR